MTSRTNRKTPPPTPRQRLFTKEFKLRDRVYIIRHEHGWSDGADEGTIIGIHSHHCTVQDDAGVKFEINHPRDIRKCH